MTRYFRIDELKAKVTFRSRGLVLSTFLTVLLLMLATLHSRTLYFQRIRSGRVHIRYVNRNPDRRSRPVSGYWRDGPLQRIESRRADPWRAFSNGIAEWNVALRQRAQLQWPLPGLLWSGLYPEWRYRSQLV